MKKLSFENDKAEVVETRGYGDGTAINIKKEVLEQACKDKKLNKREGTVKREGIIKNTYYSNGDITLVTMMPKNSEHDALYKFGEKGDYVQTCILDTNINSISLFTIIDGAKKSINLRRYKKTNEDRGSFEINIKRVNGRDIPVQVTKLLKLYEKSSINGLNVTINNGLIASHELHHYGMLADNRLKQTELFTCKAHKNYHKTYSEKGHGLICTVNTVKELEMLLNFLRSEDYAKYIKSLKK